MVVDEHKYYMAQALAMAKKAREYDEIPVGAVLVKNNKIIATAYNQPISLNDPTAHAEIQLLRQAGAKFKNYRLLDTTMYVTLEPCTMCFGALIHARIKTLVFAAKDEKTGALGGCQNLNNKICNNHSLEVISGIMAENSSRMLKDFFKNKR